MSGSPLRVLIVEDEPVIAMALEDMIEDLGFALAGTAGTLSEGLAIADTAACDIAILDVNLNGQRSDAIAALLAGRSVPYIFATGYGRTGVAGDAIVIEKPYSKSTLVDAIARATASQ